ncbi:hypothetical protein LTR56_021142 [Elasticomyces elasticus]|nr:hypothetical protein LTR56_021142 [Elasticomyces elasticus]KAK3631817.1 hypothetical protein LTR22_020885 [Elasticomyces elasticus]KAK4909673.1 hypothetical protein LTR49_021567 [Elasticomyces elasticus]KAK5749535.1 hypothetical protein LTS12_020401 [Elasticomyces elasticus]
MAIDKRHGLAIEVYVYSIEQTNSSPTRSPSTAEDAKRQIIASLKPKYRTMTARDTHEPHRKPVFKEQATERDRKPANLRGRMTLDSWIAERDGVPFRSASRDRGEPVTPVRGGNGEADRDRSGAPRRSTADRWRKFWTGERSISVDDQHGRQPSTRPEELERDVRRASMLGTFSFAPPSWRTVAWAGQW